MITLKEPTQSDSKAAILAASQKRVELVPALEKFAAYQIRKSVGCDPRQDVMIISAKKGKDIAFLFGHVVFSLFLDGRRPLTNSLSEFYR